MKKKQPKPKVTVQYATCELFASYPLRCPLCGVDVPANMPHSCAKAQVGIE